MHSSYTGLIQQAKIALGRQQLPIAEKLLQEALKRSPEQFEGHYLLASLRLGQGRHREAELAFRRAHKLAPQHAQPLNGLGSALQAQGKLEAAIKCFEQALERDRQSASILNNLGVLSKQLGPLQQAEQYYRQAVEQEEAFGDALNNLAFVLQEQGKIDEAIDCFERAVASGRCRASADSNALMCRNYKVDLSPQALLQAHLDWAKTLNRQPPARQFSAQIPAHSPLRIGFLSGDFRSHPVATFLLPLLANLDRDRFELICYHNFPGEDERTLEIKQQVSRWVPCAQMTDEQLAGIIRADQIQFLIELSGHTGRNRLRMLQERVAPVQISWLGYPATTGLPTMDYKITDAVADPHSDLAAHYSEQLLRMPNSFLCYQGDPSLPERGVSQRAAFEEQASTERITFGCFNNLAKVNAAVLDVWAELLKKIPNAELVLKATQFRCPDTRDSIRDQLLTRGVKNQQLTILPPQQSERDHLLAYQQIDIMLDTFPYNGTTTTCEALWMGVPVLTLSGDRHAARVGASLLTAAGLDDWIATDAPGFIQRACEKVSDPRALRALQSSLRQRLQLSPLGDAKAFARAFEDLLTGLTVNSESPQ